VFSQDGAHGVIGSWLADRPNGFTEREIAELKIVQKHIAVVCKMRMEAEIAHNVAATYLGSRSGQRVLNGRIKRGDTEQVRGAIWYSDLRNSTELSRQNEPERFLDILNTYFEVTAGSVMESGGEVLLLIGDAVLAIFPGEQDADMAGSCSSALDAVRRSADRMRDTSLNAGQDPHQFRFGVGLHVGEFMLGNIGVPSRLEFTAIGPAINEVARLEALTKETGHTVVASGAFAGYNPDQWKALGRHSLRGFGEPVEVYGL